MVVVAICIALVSLLGSAGLSAEARSAHRDAPAYAARYGVSLENAARQLDFQVAAGRLEAQLATQEHATFAGLWITRTPQFRVVIAFTRDAEATAAPYLASSGLADVAEVRTAKSSLSDLRSELMRLTTWKERPFAAGLRVQENAIEIRVISETDFRAWAKENGLVLPPDALVVEVTQRERPTADIYGGLSLDGNGCTSGFGVKNSSGTKGITTAGHCGDTASYNGTNLPYQGGSWGGWYDVQWHTAPGFTVRNWITDVNNPPTYTRPITSKTYWGSQTVGGMVCRYGRTSGYDCGEISQKDYIPWWTCVPDARPVWVLVDIGSAGGDSGGPWFLNESAYGTQSCGDTNLSVYSAVDFVEDGANVTILTN